MRTNTRGLAAVAISLALVAMACGDDEGGIVFSPSEPTPTQPSSSQPDTSQPDTSQPDTSEPSGDASGLMLHQGEGFSILMPEGWTIVATADMDLEELFGAVASTVDSEALARQVLDMFDRGGKLFAFDFEGSSGQFVDNINIITAPRPPATAEELEAATLDQMRLVLGATNLESEIVAVPAGEAVIIRYRLPSQATDGISATIITPTSHWAITLSAGDTGPMDATFMAMIESFRETP